MASKKPSKEEKKARVDQLKYGYPTSGDRKSVTKAPGPRFSKEQPKTSSSGGPLIRALVKATEPRAPRGAKPPKPAKPVSKATKPRKPRSMAKTRSPRRRVKDPD